MQNTIISSFVVIFNLFTDVLIVVMLGMLVYVCFLLGGCSKVHDEELRRNYEQSDSRWERGYEEEFLRYMEGIVGDMDKKIDRGRDRLRQNEEYVKEEVSTLPSVLHHWV